MKSFDYRTILKPLCGFMLTFIFSIASTSGLAPASGLLKDGDQPCNDCEVSPWSLPQYTQLTQLICVESNTTLIPEVAKPLNIVNVKYRQRYNNCLNKFEVYLEWVKFTDDDCGSFETEASNSFSAPSDAQCSIVATNYDVLELIRIDLLRAQIFEILPVGELPEGDCLEVSVVQSACWRVSKPASCPTQYIECSAEPCCRIQYEVCVDEASSGGGSAPLNPNTTISISRTPSQEVPPTVDCSAMDVPPGESDCINICEPPSSGT